MLWVFADILASGRVAIDEAKLDGKSYADFDAAELTVKLPETKQEVRVTAAMASREVRGRLRQIAHHPRVEFMAGLMFAVAGLVEAGEPFLKETFEHGLSAEWGMVLFGVFAMVKGIAGRVEGADWLERAEHEHLA